MVIRSDAWPAGKRAAFEKALDDSPRQFSRRMAEGTAELPLRYLEGEAPEESTLIPGAHHRYGGSTDAASRIEEQW